MTTTAEVSTLFSLTDDLRALDAALTESLGELTPEIEATMARLQASFAAKADACAFYAKSLEADIAATETHVAHFTAKLTVLKHKQTAWKQYLHSCLSNLKATEVKGSVYTIALQANGGKAPLQVEAVYVADPSALPSEYQRVKIEVDTDALREAADGQGKVWFQGYDEQGPVERELIAQVMPRGSHVRIK